MKRLVFCFILVFSVLLTACGTDKLTSHGEGENASPAVVSAQKEGENASSAVVSTQKAEKTDDNWSNSKLFEWESGDFLSIKLKLPDNWEAELIESDEEVGAGIKFWPEGQSDKALYLRRYGKSFGVCGTGLEEAISWIEGTGNFISGFYNGSKIPDFINFCDSPGGYVLTDISKEIWAEYQDDIKKILSGLTLDEGVIRYADALAVVMEKSDASYDYVQSEFDAKTGKFTVILIDENEEVLATFVLDAQGNIIR